MEIIEVNELSIPGVKVLKYPKYLDRRGYFSETFRRSDFVSNPKLEIFKNLDFLQANESYSKANVVRGLHFQWNPYLGKLVRVIHGRMVDLILDIRKGSPTLGKITAYDMKAVIEREFNEWIWVPPGCAHGNFFTEPTVIEYFCTGEYNPKGETGISPLSLDLNWDLFPKDLGFVIENLRSPDLMITDKDRAGSSLTDWLADRRSDYFQFGSL